MPCSLLTKYVALAHALGAQVLDVSVAGVLKGSSERSKLDKGNNEHSPLTLPGKWCLASELSLIHI